MKYLNSNPIFVDWAITTKCNLNCTHCRYYTKLKTKREKGKTELNNTQAKKLAKEIVHLNPNWILIEGGEPFLREDLFDIITNLHETNRNSLREIDRNLSYNNKFLQVSKNFNEFPIYIITSGKGFNEELAKRCKDSGVKLMISVDSANGVTYEKIRQGATFNRVINAIEIANNYNILDSINYTLQKLNTSTKEIRAIGKFANKYDIKKINFLGYKPNVCTVSKTSVPDFSKIFSNIVDIQKKYGLQVMVDEPFFKPWLENSKFQIPNSKFKKTGPIVVEDKSGCIFGEYLFIEPDGTLKPCSFSPISIKQIGKQTIKKIQNKRNRKGKCAKCEYLLQCGGCRVRTYVMTGDWFASDPYCPL
jgi:radical SAM protein with 4Fe4S-binding SPASM domain